MQAQPFYLFGPDHWASIGITVLVSVIFIFIFRKGVKDAQHQDHFARVLGFILIAYEIFKVFYRTFTLGEAWQVTMPLNLCQLADIMLGLMLIYHKYLYFEIAYFWAIGGGTMAVLTPDLALGFPDPQYIMHNITHTLIYVGVLYGLIIWRYRPGWHSVKVSFGAGAIVMVFVFPLNYLLGNGANYLFLRYRPQAGSLMDMMPEPPFHVPVVIFLAVIIYLLSFLPFMFRRKVGDITQG